MKNNNLGFLFKPLFFLAALVISTFLILWIEKLKPSDMGDYQTIFQREILIAKTGNYPLRKKGNISSEELNYARIAWRYFENNYNESTGFVNESNHNQVFTIADEGSYLMALSSAYELNIIDSLTFDKRIKKLASGIKSLQLCNDILPNELYNSVSLKMLNRSLNPSKNGSGWSSIDISRFISSVNKIKEDYPQYHLLFKEATRKWRIKDMIIDGYLYAGIFNGKSLIKSQEGTLGYEEYSAKNLLKAGYDATNALSYTDFIKFLPVYNSQIGVDTRGTNNNPVFSCLVSEPFLLDGLENGWDNSSRELAFRLYESQKSRYFETGIVTAMAIEPTEENEIYYNCIYANGKTWCCTDRKGENKEDMKSLSTKASFGWNALFNDKYSEILIKTVKHLNEPNKGWYAGKFEKDSKINKNINIQTNSIVLEAINYKKNGPLINTE